MSLIAEYRSTEAALQELKTRLESLQTDSRLQKELEFEEKLRGLMGEYGKSLRDIIGILDPNSQQKQAPAKPSRSQRKVKRYVNPHNGEQIETKGGNHKVLKQWKEEYGNDTVESWLQA